MELIYLWVKNYKNIKNQGFNFSSRFKCEFFPEFEQDENSNEKLKDNCKLRIEESKDYFHIFPENINVTAIVGKNGSGKSSLLEILTNKYNPTDFQNIFFIFYDKSNKTLTFHGAKYDIKSSVNTIDIQANSEIAINLVGYFEELNSTKTIYFSNILNETDLTTPIFFNKQSYSHTVNISTTQILNQMKLIETKYDGINSESRTGFDKIYRSYRIQEIQRAIMLIKDNAIKIPFELPTTIQIKNINFNSFIQNAKNKFENKYYTKIFNIINNNNSSKTIFKNYLSTNLIITLLLENANHNNPVLNELLHLVLDRKLSSSLDDFYKNVKNDLYNYDFTLNGEHCKMESIDTFFDLADEILDSLEKFKASNQEQFYLELDIKNTNFEFLKTYEKLIQQSEYFWDIGWRGLSSGEETFLYQFSRFYFLNTSLKDDLYLNLKVDNSVANNIILLIDEGETTLHPKWQNVYVKYLIKFLEDNFKQNIHLILTSHSPFILSDIPNENIIFLDKDEKTGNCIVVDGLKEKKQTFGANIHTLLSDAFFMEDGLIGEFAKSKIDDVINFLNNKHSDIKDNDEAQKYINIIGEQIIKRQLQKMLDSKRLSKIDKINEIETKIATMQQELDNLKAQNK